MKRYGWAVSSAFLLAAVLACGGRGNASQPRQTGASQAQPSACGLRADANLRARTCPDAALPATGVLPKDARVPVVARTEDAQWWQIRVRTGTFWVYGGWATLLGDCSDVPIAACQEAVSAPAPQGEAPAPASASATTCGDEVCDFESGESCAICVADCGVCDTPVEVEDSGVEGADGSLCGDGVCQAGENPDWCGDCAAEVEAQADVAPEGCGNGACNFPVEDCFNCPDDCTLCSIESAGCGDGVCQADDPFLQENCEICRADCGPCTECGDGLCQGSEAASCPDDCGSENQLWGEWQIVLPQQEGEEDDTLVSIEAEDSLTRCGDGFCTFYERFANMPQYCPADCG